MRKRLRIGKDKTNWRVMCVVDEKKSVVDEKKMGVGTGILGLAVVGVLLGLCVFLFAMPIVNVPPGSRGVMFDRLSGGIMPASLGEGWHLRIPFSQDIYVIETRTIKHEYDASAASKDLQVVNSKVAVSWHLVPSDVPKLYKEIGPDYSDRIIAPAVQEKFKANTARFEAEDLITNREMVKISITNELRALLAPYHIMVDEVSIVNFDFSPEFNQAIEAKVVSAQMKLKAENDLQVKMVEARQKIAEAQGQANATLTKAMAEAEALKLQKEQVNKDLIALRQVERWDGRMPQYYGGNGLSLFMPIGANSS